MITASKNIILFDGVCNLCSFSVQKLLAKFRYNLFGKKEQCMLPSHEIKSRFIEERNV